MQLGMLHCSSFNPGVLFHDLSQGSCSTSALPSAGEPGVIWVRPRIHLCMPLVPEAAVAARSPPGMCRPASSTPLSVSATIVWPL